MKKQITLRIDEDVLEWFKAQGKGYHGRMNDALRDHIASLMERGAPLVDTARKEYKPRHYTDPEVKKVERHITDNFFKPMPKKK